MTWVDLEGKTPAKVALALLVSVMMAISCGFATTAFADEENAAVEAKTVEAAPVGDWVHLGRDLVWAGDACTLGEGTVENDFLAAGRKVTVNKAKVLGSIRAAGQSITVKDAVVSENITIAGETLSIEGGNATSVTMASRASSFAGEASGLYVFAETAYIDGVVHGNAVVRARTLEVGPHAVIEGSLRVTASEQPVVDSQASIGKLDVEIQQGDSSQDAEALGGIGVMAIVIAVLMSVIGSLVVALLAEWLFKRHTATAAQLIKERTGPMIGSGVIGVIAAPVVALVLCFFIVTLPVAGALVLALIAMGLVCTGFLGASVFKLAFPKLGRFKTALAGGAIVGVAGAVPILGLIVTAAAFVYLLGYVLQSIFLSLRDRSDAPNGPTAPEEPVPWVPSVAVPSANAPEAPAARADYAATAAPTAPDASAPAFSETAASSSGAPTPPLRMTAAAQSVEDAMPAQTSSPAWTAGLSGELEGAKPDAWEEPDWKVEPADEDSSEK